MMPGHSTLLRGGPWRLWRTLCLRGAGFPAALVQRLAAPEAAAAAEELFAAEEDVRATRAKVQGLLRARMEGASADDAAALQRALRRIQRNQALESAPLVADVAEAMSRARAREERARVAVREAMAAASASTAATLREVCADASFREAVTWQNRRALGVLDTILRHEGPSDARHRRDQELVVSYLQRYCTKNDSIGFFGPWGWAELAPDGPPLVLEPGKHLLARRTVFFEQWPMDALAEVIGRDDAVRAWTPPRRLPFVVLEGDVARTPLGASHALSAQERLVLGACDGMRLVGELAEALVEEHPDVFEIAEDVEEIVHSLVQKELVQWTFGSPMVLRPDVPLRQRIERIGDEALRGAALARLDALEGGRRKVERALGDPIAVGEALAELADTFVRVTGAGPTRGGGETYAGRGIVYEDAVRDAHVVVGPQLVDAIGAALELLLTTSRWLTHRVATEFEKTFLALHRELAGARGAVPFVDFWIRAQRLLYGASMPATEHARQYVFDRWQSFMGDVAGRREVHLDGASLAPRVSEAFAAPGPGWPWARYHSPDLLIGASGPDAFARGEFFVVLGEMHAGLLSIEGSGPFSMHPDPVALLAAVREDVPEPRYLLLPAKHWPTVTVRTIPAMLTDKDFWVEPSFDEAPGDRSRVLGAGELEVVERDGRLHVRCATRGVDAPLVHFLAPDIGNQIVQGFRLLPPASHVPRVTIDRLVVSRESWTLSPDAMAFAFEKDETARFLGARRFARDHGMPRFVFAKAAVEAKPFYVDLHSPAYVTLLSKLVRKAKEAPNGEVPITLVEMLPSPEQLWLADAEGRLYTSELRCFAVDSMPPSAQGS